MNKKRVKRIILGLTTVALALTTLYSILVLTEPEIPKTTVTEYPVNIFAASNQEIKTNFDQIHSIEYDVETCNCTTKAGLFGDYLLSQNATNVKTISFSRSDNGYGHMAIEYDNHIYDPTSGAYNQTKEEYTQWIQSKGFDGPIITETFIGNNKAELCQVMAEA